MTWTPQATLAAGSDRPRVFVHLIGAEGQIVRTFDHELPSEWRVGVPIAYRLVIDQSQLGPPVVGGSYPLLIGLYQPSTGARLPVAPDDGGRSVERLQVATVEAAPFGGPGLVELSAEWSRIEAGEDRQILGRTWLRARQGRLTFERLPEGAALWLALHIPNFESAVGTAVFDGDGPPEVVISDGCGLQGAAASGVGPHELELRPLAGPAVELPCELTVTTNFTSLEPDGRERSVVLEKVAWLGAT